MSRGVASRAVSKLSHINKEPFRFQFDITIHEISDLPSTASTVLVQWQRGAKNVQTPEALVMEGRVVWSESLSMVSTLYRSPKSPGFLPKEYKFSVVEAKKRKRVGKVHIDLGKYATIPNSSSTETFVVDCEKLRAKPRLKVTINSRFISKDSKIGETASEVSAFSMGVGESQLSDSDAGPDVANLEDLDGDELAPKHTSIRSISRSRVAAINAPPRPSMGMGMGRPPMPVSKRGVSSLQIQRQVRRMQSDVTFGARRKSSASQPPLDQGGAPAQLTRTTSQAQPVKASLDPDFSSPNAHRITAAGLAARAPSPPTLSTDSPPTVKVPMAIPALAITATALEEALSPATSPASPVSPSAMMPAPVSPRSRSSSPPGSTGTKSPRGDGDESMEAGWKSKYIAMMSEIESTRAEEHKQQRESEELRKLLTARHEEAKKEARVEAEQRAAAEEREREALGRVAEAEAGRAALEARVGELEQELASARDQIQEASQYLSTREEALRCTIASERAARETAEKQLSSLHGEQLWQSHSASSSPTPEVAQLAEERDQLLETNASLSHELSEAHSQLTAAVRELTQLRRRAETDTVTFTRQQAEQATRRAELHALVAVLESENRDLTAQVDSLTVVCERAEAEASVVKHRLDTLHHAIAGGVEVTPDHGVQDLLEKLTETTALKVRAEKRAEGEVSRRQEVEISSHVMQGDILVLQSKVAELETESEMRLHESETAHNEEVEKLREALSEATQTSQQLRDEAIALQRQVVSQKEALVAVADSTGSDLAISLASAREKLLETQAQAIQLRAQLHPAQAEARAAVAEIHALRSELETSQAHSKALEAEVLELEAMLKATSNHEDTSDELEQARATISGLREQRNRGMSCKHCIAQRFSEDVLTPLKAPRRHLSMSESGELFAPNYESGTEGEGEGEGEEVGEVENWGYHHIPLRDQYRAAIRRIKRLEIKLQQITQPASLDRDIEAMTEQISEVLKRKEAMILRTLQQVALPTKASKKTDSRVLILEEQARQAREEKDVLTNTIKELGEHMCQLVQNKDALVDELLDEKERLEAQLDRFRNSQRAALEARLTVPETPPRTPVLSMEQGEGTQDGMEIASPCLTPLMSKPLTEKETEGQDGIGNGMGEASGDLSERGEDEADVDLEWRQLDLMALFRLEEELEDTQAALISCENEREDIQDRLSQAEQAFSKAKATVSALGRKVTNLELELVKKEGMEGGEEPDEDLAVQVVNLRQQLVHAKIKLAQSLEHNDELSQQIKQLKNSRLAST